MSTKLPCARLPSGLVCLLVLAPSVLAPSVAAQKDDVAELSRAIRTRADAAAVASLDRLAAGKDDVAARARKEEKSIVASAPEQLEALAQLEAGTLQKLAAAEVARLRAKEPKWPVADTRRVETWWQAQIAQLQKGIEQDRTWNKQNPNRIYDWRIKASEKQLAELRALNIRAAGLRLLGEYYEATRQTKAAVAAVTRHHDLAEAAKNLPSITVETRYGRVDGAGEMMVESTEEHEVDVAKWASAFFNMASAQSAVDAKRAREQAAADRAVLVHLSETTLDALKRAYADRVAAEVKALEQRRAETRRQNLRRRR